MLYTPDLPIYQVITKNRLLGNNEHLPVRLCKPYKACLLTLLPLTDEATKKTWGPPYDTLQPISHTACLINLVFFLVLLREETANKLLTSLWGCVAGSLPAVSLLSLSSSVRSWSSTDMQDRSTQRKSTEGGGTGLSTQTSGNRGCPGQQAQKTEHHWYPGGKRERKNINIKGKASRRQVMKFQEIHHYMTID